MTLDEMERVAYQRIKRGETNLAVKQIYDLVLAWAKKKDFENARKWRNKIIEIDPKAIAAILGSDEIIELEKANTIEQHHQNIWSDLYATLNQDEGKAIYPKLKQREILPGKILIKQGTINNTLFFIDSGQLKNIFGQDGKEIFLHDIEQGHTAGQDTFFDNFISTSNVVAISPVKVMVFNRPDMLDIENQLPGFAEKLKNYCFRLETKNQDILNKNKTLERRQHYRHKLVAEISIQIFDKNKKPIYPTFNGTMDDISIGGASFTLNGSGKDVARSLLGRITTLTLKNESHPEIVLKGFILGANFDKKSTYTISIRFFKTYTKADVLEIADKHPLPSQN
jgi:CRP-like cAMP-binding protein